MNTKKQMREKNKKMKERKNEEDIKKIKSICQS